jgi:hypothetical protein
MHPSNLVVLCLLTACAAAPVPPTFSPDPAVNEDLQPRALRIYVHGGLNHRDVRLETPATVRAQRYQYTGSQRRFEMGQYEIANGTLKVNLTLTNYRQQANKLFAEDELDDDNGTLRSPSRSGSLDLTYKVKDWGFYFGTEWIGKMSSYEYLGEDPATSTYKLNTPSYFQHAMSVSYGDSISKWKVTVGVRNLTNAALPSISAQAGYNKVGNAPLYSGYDYIGRRLFLNATKTF